MALVPLDNRVLPYIREELAKPHPLAEQLGHLPWDQGAFWAFVPGSNSREKRLETRNAFLDFIVAYLHADGARALVMSNPYLTYADNRSLQQPRIGRTWTDWLPCGDYACFYADESADVIQIIHLFDDAQASTTFGVLARNAAVQRHGEHSPERLHSLVSHADYALFEIDAYDNSAVLIWSRAGTVGGEAK